MDANPAEEAMVARLNALRIKYESALHQLHKGEMSVRRLEEVLASTTEPTTLRVDRSTSTAHDFGLQAGPGLSPYTQLMHLEAVLAREQRDYEELKREHTAAVTQLTREGLELMSLLGDPTAPLGGIDLAHARARLNVAAQAALATDPYETAETEGGRTIAQLPADSLIHP
jgi:hypothetical protein